MRPMTLKEHLDAAFVTTRIAVTNLRKRAEAADDADAVLLAAILGLKLTNYQARKREAVEDADLDADDHT